MTAPFPARADGGWTIDRLMATLAKVKSRQVPYTETTIMAILDTPLVSSGTLSFSAPARFTQHVTSPQDELFQADDDVLRVIIPAHKIDRSVALKDDPMAWALVEGFRATFTGDLTALRRFYGLSLSGDRQRWFLTLTPRLSQMAAKVSSIEIVGDGDRVGEVKVNETDGDRMVLTMGRSR